MKTFLPTLLLSCLTVFGIVNCSAAKEPTETANVLLPQSEKDFWAKLLVMKQADLVEFDKPSDQIPEIREVGTAKIGDAIALKLIFTRMELRTDNTADVSFDIEITKPDGTPYEGGVHKDITALNQVIPVRERMFNSDAVLVLGFEADDPLGVYDIKMTVRDRVGGTELFLTENIRLTE